MARYAAALLSGALLVLQSEVAAQTEGRPEGLLPNISTNGAEVTFIGRIDSAAADALIVLLKTNQFRTLRIDSPGGDVAAGMRIGDAIHGLSLDVVVSRICTSSCANYVFPAGANKRIDEGAFVLWHGDARQWNFVAEMDRLQKLDDGTGADQLNESERRWLNSYRKVVHDQDDYYRRIGIRDGLARIGHETTPRARAWTVTVSTMAQYGIRNVAAPPNYGTTEYCDKWAMRYPSGVITCLPDLRPQARSAPP
jgi:hypothetical protein